MQKEWRGIARRLIRYIRQQQQRKRAREAWTGYGPRCTFQAERVQALLLLLLYGCAQSKLQVPIQQLQMISLTTKRLKCNFSFSPKETHYTNRIVTATRSLAREVTEQRRNGGRWVLMKFYLQFSTQLEWREEIVKQQITTSVNWVSWRHWLPTDNFISTYRTRNQRLINFYGLQLSFNSLKAQHKWKMWVDVECGDTWKHVARANSRNTEEKRKNTWNLISVVATLESSLNDT